MITYIIATLLVAIYAKVKKLRFGWYVLALLPSINVLAVACIALYIIIGFIGVDIKGLIAQNLVKYAFKKG